jgi:ubiquinone/menaquinone biosynthesis C-methylase UbiE
MGPTGDVYTHGHQEAVLRSHRWRTAENSARYLLGLLKPGMRLLDVGCGPGTITSELAQRVAPGAVLGVDVDEAVLDEAERFAARQAASNLSFAAGDFRALRLPGQSFDVVHAHQVLQHLRDPVGALAEMRRLAAPGAIVAVRDCDYSAFAWAPDDERLDRWMRVYLQVTRQNGSEANAGRYLLGWAQQAGFSEITYTTSNWTFCTPPDRAWWGGLWAERMLVSSFADQARDYGFATRDDLKDMSDGFREWATCADGVFVVVNGEVIARV